MDTATTTREYRLTVIEDGEPTTRLLVTTDQPAADYAAAYLREHWHSLRPAAAVELDAIDPAGGRDWIAARADKTEWTEPIPDPVDY